MKNKKKTTKSRILSKTKKHRKQMVFTKFEFENICKMFDQFDLINPKLIFCIVTWLSGISKIPFPDFWKLIQTYFNLHSFSLFVCSVVSLFACLLYISNVQDQKKKKKFHSNNKFSRLMMMMKSRLSRLFVCFANSWNHFSDISGMFINICCDIFSFEFFFFKYKKKL